VLIGGLKPEDKKYFESLKNMASFYPNIVFRPNISHHDLAHIYRSGDFYLHFAGWGIDGSAHPERTEHLGITPMEAMSYGCIPLCYENGGIPEVIDTGINGYTFKTLDELTMQVKRLCTDTVLQESFRKAGTEKIHRVFSKSALNIALQKL
jgi:glycosyltransferase involved in cell wall biosynthesis